MAKVPSTDEIVRGDRIIVTLTNKEKKAMTQAAKQKGLPVSLWARMTLLESIKNT